MLFIDEDSGMKTTGDSINFMILDCSAVESNFHVTKQKLNSVLVFGILDHSIIIICEFKRCIYNIKGSPHCQTPFPYLSFVFPNFHLQP